MGKINKNNDNEKRALLREQDLKIIKGLSGNDKKVRERILRNLKKWFEQRSSKIPFTKEDFLRFWKGLFYTMWMSDKPLVQEECAEKIAQLVHFSDPQTALLFFRCSLIVLSTEWFGIDQLRLDKFLMFVRRILRKVFEVLKEHDWDYKLIVEFGNILSETVLKCENNTYLGLTMHVTEIYLEELAKVSNGEIEKDQVAELIKPFVEQLSRLTDNRQISHVRKFLFHHLLYQSDEGIEYQVRFDAWKERGFPGGTIDSLEKIERSDDEDLSDADDVQENQKPLDPRAGHVDVELPQIPFDAKEISQMLLDHRFSDGSTTIARKAITKLAKEFEELSKGVFPIGMKEIRMPDVPGYSTKLKKSVNRLVKFEKKLLGNNNKNRKRKHKRKFDEIETNGNDNESDTEISEDKLQEFIRKSEGNLVNGSTSKKKKLKTTNEKNVKNMKNKLIKPNWSYEESFQRNSGTWFVERLDSDDSYANGSLMDIFPTKKSRKQSAKVIEKEGIENNKELFLNEKSPKKKKSINEPILNGSPKKSKPGNGIIPKRKTSIEQTDSNHKDTKIKTPIPFPQSEWESPPKEGEIEIFVPSNKYKEKMKVLAKKTNKTVEELIDDAVNNVSKRHSLNIAVTVKNKKKQRFSLDTNIIKNPFAKNCITPRSEKKVKIDLKLNQSQEIHEHRAQLRKSPAIPYDANKKPSKPLLKSHAVASPINPFYRRLIHF